MRLKPAPIKLWAIIGALAAGLVLPSICGFPISRILHPVNESGNTKPFFLNIKGLEHLATDKKNYVLVLMSTDCLHCRESVEALNRWVKESSIPEIIAVTSSSKEQIESFINDFQPLFTILRIEEDDFWRLLEDGDIPRVILLDNQKIVKVWDKELPDMKDIKVYTSP